ncbi:MAG: hypothetical protein J6V89_03920 [Acetobacter sp.]|nr:hypothetical protein [Acetobacter sp.]
MSKIIGKILNLLSPFQITPIARAFSADTRGLVAIKRWDAVSRFNLSLFKKKGLEICALLERKEFDKARKLTLEVKELLYRETHIPPYRRTTLHSLLNQLFRFTFSRSNLDSSRLESLLDKMLDYADPAPFSRSNLDSSRLESLLDKMLEYADNEQHRDRGQEKQGAQNLDLDLEACKQKFETMSIVPQTDPPGFALYKMKYPKFLSTYSLYLGEESSHELHEQNEEQD